MTPPPDVPRVVLGHEVVGALGSGATARVLSATTPGGAPVALKRLHPHLARDVDVRARLHDEARALSRAAGPRVVAIHDVLDDGVELALVLDLVHGPSIARVLDDARARAEPVPPARALAWTRASFEALAHVHAAGLVHADVGPRNVLTRGDDVVLIDFGFAGPASTANGPIRGTLGYLAPEQASGAATPASDVFAAGVMLWELLRGERYRPTTSPAAQLASLPTEPRRPVHHARPDLAPYAGLLDALLAPSRADRPTATDAAHLLSGFR